MRALRADLLTALDRLPDQRDRRLVIGQNIGVAGDADEGYRQFIDDPAARCGDRRPLLVGVDYGWDRIDAADIARANRVLIDHWNKGGLVTVCMHPGNPGVDGGTVQECEGIDLAAVMTPGTAAHRRWMAVLATVGDGLAELHRAGVIVLWRPFHEMNGGWFWWGCERQGVWTDPRQFAELWRHCHRYLTVERKLDNLLWVYAPNARLDDHTRPVAAYFPGNDVVDIVGYDIYTDHSGSTTWDAYGSYRDLIALGKPFAITELGPGKHQRGAFDNQVAISSLLAACPRACLAMYWHGWTERRLLGDRSMAMALAENPNAAEMMARDDVRTLSDGRPLP